MADGGGTHEMMQALLEQNRRLLELIERKPEAFHVMPDLNKAIYDFDGEGSSHEAGAWLKRQCGRTRARTETVNIRDVHIGNEHSTQLSFFRSLQQPWKPLKKRSYLLYAVVAHSGSSPIEGHYIAYAEDNKIWYKFNDETVTAIEDVDNEFGSTFLLENTYLELYKRTTGLLADQ
ncbi:hypothetical protein HPB50_010380 [Hyalomma asiaticum]|uniref:Uncharacterized protein n=1 Tax=Hyalomma asiaticum TaxID=266040 RepID=A0ACB7SBL0_HYAAI|nr:hypothetical protein HPB50_010380 [Hyalomma asiaticum]